MSSTPLVLVRKSNAMAPNALAFQAVLACAGLLLLCLPLNHLPTPFIGLQRPSAGFTWLLQIFIVTLGCQQVARLQKLYVTPFTNQMLLAALLAAVPCFYFEVQGDAALSTGLNLLLAFFILISLYQFNFSMHLRVALLSFPLFSCWLLGVLHTTLFIFFDSSLSAVFAAPYQAQTTAAVLLLTGYALSAYLLGQFLHLKPRRLFIVMLLLTPALCWYLIGFIGVPHFLWLGLAMLFLIQPFLLRHSRRWQHIAWIASSVVGIASLAMRTPELLSMPLFSQEQLRVVELTLQFLFEHPLSGVGVGNLDLQLLLSNLHSPSPIKLPESQPSWLLAHLAQGGLMTLLAVVVAMFALCKRVLLLPIGRRLIFVALLLPILFAVLVSGFGSLNPVLVVVLLLLLFWIDSVHASAWQVVANPLGIVGRLSQVGLLVCALIALSSLYLGSQSLNLQNLSDKQLAQFSYHPWWKTKFQNEISYRRFLNDVAAGDVANQRTYLTLRQQQLRENPTLESYKQLHDIAIQAGDKAMAKGIAKEAGQLFPMDKI
ncbi:MAG: hypothetical protein ACRC24_05865 [Vibrionaceae bacterium]